MRGQSVVFSDFRGGVNLDSAPYSLDLNQARDLLNVNTNAIGSLYKRNGFRNIHITPPALPLTSLFPFHSSPDQLVAIGDNNVSTDVYSVSTSGAVASIKAGTVTSGHRWDAIQATTLAGPLGPLFMSNGQDTPRHWTGSGNIGNWTAPTSGSVPNGKYLAYHDNRVFVSGVAGSPYKLYWSGIGNAGDWASPSGGETSFDPDDGEPITGIGTVGPYLLVFKASKTYVVFNTDTGGYRRISDSVGCIANKSIVEGEQGTYFLSNGHGIMLTDGTTIQPISVGIDSLVSSISTTNSKNATGVYANRKYYLSFDVGGTNDTIVEFDSQFGSWFVHKIQVTSSTTTGVNDWAILNPGTSNTLYAASGSTSTPRVYEAFADGLYKDTDLIYDSYWTTQWHTFEMPHIRKILRQLRADALGQMEVSFSKSFNTTFNSEQDLIWEIAEGSGGSGTFGSGGTFGGGVGVFGGEQLVQEHRYYTLGTGRAFSFNFSSPYANRFELYAYTVALDSRRD